MNSERRRIFAFSGVLKPRPGGPPPSALLDFALTLAAASGPVRKVCLIPTAVGAWHVTSDGNGGYTEQPVVPRLITYGRD